MTHPYEALEHVLATSQNMATFDTLPFHHYGVTSFNTQASRSPADQKAVPTPHQQGDDPSLGQGFIMTNKDAWYSYPIAPVPPESVKASADFHVDNNFRRYSVISHRSDSVGILAAGSSDLAAVQEQTRIERRKSQNRNAQRAYRERKEKSIAILREKLEHKEGQLRALQEDHGLLREQYESLLAARQEFYDLSITATLAPADLLSPMPLLPESGGM